MKYILLFLLILNPLAALAEEYEIIGDPMDQYSPKAIQQQRTNELVDALTERTRQEAYQIQIQNNNLLYGQQQQQYYVAPPGASTQDRAIGSFANGLILGTQQQQNQFGR